MDTITQKIATLNWADISESLNQKGYALLPRFLDMEACDALANLYPQDGLYRKTVIMERHRYGLGEYRYFDYPLPDIVNALRSAIYPHLVPVANLWMRALGLEKRFPPSLELLHAECRLHGQAKPTALILQYGKGGFNTLHQDIYGEVYFPMQAVVMLSEPGTDYTGGEFVFTEQLPRAQSKAIVLQPQKGDMLIFTTNFRPAKGARGYYRSSMRHA